MGKWYTAVVSSVLTLGFSVTGYAQEMDLSMILEHHQASVFLQSSGQTYLSGVAGEQRDGKPPPSARRIEREILFGIVGAMVGMVPGFGMAYAFGVGEEEDLSAVRLVLGYTMATAAWSLCSAAGVYIVGTSGNETGSFLATMSGAAAGLGMALVDAEIDLMGFNNALLLFTAPTIGAIIGFNLTRRYDSPPAKSETAPMDARGGKMGFAVRGAYSRPDPLRVDLLRGRF